MTFKQWQVCAILGLVMASYSTSPALAVQYDFLTVTGNGVAGNGATSTFTSPNGNGVISVSNSFSAGGAGNDDNNNPLIFYWPRVGGGVDDDTEVQRVVSLLNTGTTG